MWRCDDSPKPDGRASRRGEIWWIAETMRLQALADRAVRRRAQAVAWLDAAEALATRLGAGIVLPRIAASR